MEITNDSVIKHKGREIDAKHVQNVMNKLIDCYESGKLCDVTLVAGENDCKIPAHRLILSAVNPYFDAMFTSPLKEKDQKEVVLNEIHGDELKTLIDFCYTGYIDINEDNVYGIFGTASRMEFADIEEKCCDFFRDNLSLSNCLTIWTFCEPYPYIKYITKQAQTYSEANFLEVVDTYEFLLLDADHLFTLFSSDDLDVWSEEEVFNALAKWVTYDEEGRKCSVRKLMSAIRFSQLRTEFLYSNVGKLCRKFDCFDLFEKSSFEKLFPRDAIHPCLPRKSCTMKWLIAVGNDGFQNPEYRNSEIYSPMTNKWRIFKGIKWERDGSSFIIASSELYILGGLKRNRESLSSVFKYNFTTNKLTEVAPMKVGRAYFDVAVLNNNIFVAGGIDSSSVERYDLGTGEWFEMPSMLAKRQNHKLAILNGRLFAIGGRNNANKALRSIESFDLFQNKWQSRASMKYVRFSHGVLVRNNKIIVFGGLGEVELEARNEFYSPLINKWSESRKFPITLYGFGSIMVNEKIYIYGGATENKTHLNGYQFDLEASKFEEIVQLNYERMYHGLFQMPPYNPN